MSDLRPVEGTKSSTASALWQLWADTGGTFTDCMAISPDRAIHRLKVLSDGSLRGLIVGQIGAQRYRLGTDWQLPEGFFVGATFSRLGSKVPGIPIRGYDAKQRIIQLTHAPSQAMVSATPFEIRTGLEAPVLAAHWLTQTPLDRALPVMTMRLATTRGTNALLERRGSATALFVTRGFADLLVIGEQQRPELFTLAVVKPDPIYREVIEVDERVSASGEVLRPPDLEALRGPAEQALQRGIKVAAVALMHSYRNPRHEELLAEFLASLGYSHVSWSSRLAARIKLLPRAETTVINAYLVEVIGDYVARVAAAVKGGPLHLLTSTGSLTRDSSYMPKDSLLSGPAGGVVGATAMALQSGFRRSLAFDMGGTSTDVSRFDGRFDYRFETRVGDARLLAPSLAIETVAAGGGSICHFDGRQLKVGPESAGASPGPACYAAGGPLTLTDVNLLLGRLQPASFEIPIDVGAARRAAEELVASVQSARREAVSLEELLLGWLEIANERMAEAVRRVSIRRGYRPSDYVLVAFGGAGGQHACALAEILEIDTVLVPLDAGLLSAVGLGRATVEHFVERQLLRGLTDMGAELRSVVDELELTARTAVVSEGVDPQDVEIRRRLIHLRLKGQETTLTVEYDPDRPLQELFVAAYEDHYGYRPEEAAIEIESVRIVAASRQSISEAPPTRHRMQRPRPGQTRRVYLEGGWFQVPTHWRSSLAFGARLAGPALIFERHCATLVPRSWRARVDATGSLVLERSQTETMRPASVAGGAAG